MLTCDPASLTHKGMCSQHFIANEPPLTAVHCIDRNLNQVLMVQSPESGKSRMLDELANHYQPTIWHWESLQVNIGS